MTLTVCWVKNMNGLLVEYVGTLPLRVRKGSSLMVWARPSVFAVMGVGKLPLYGGCVLAWWVCDGAVEYNGSLQRRWCCFPTFRCSTVIVHDD